MKSNKFIGLVIASGLALLVAVGMYFFGVGQLDKAHDQQTAWLQDGGDGHSSMATETESFAMSFFIIGDRMVPVALVLAVLALCFRRHER